ncbi:MAG: cyclic nucleotide-binding domain-containing protein [Verrucomicrobiota bacterium]
MGLRDFEILLDTGILSTEEGISDETRRILAEEDFTEIVSIKKETILVEQGTRPEALFFTIDGKFHAISHANPDAPNRLLGRIGEGQFIGEVCLVDPTSKASATVKALPDSMVLKMKPEAFESLCKSHPVAANEFLLSVARQLAKRLREANERVL